MNRVYTKEEIIAVYFLIKLLLSVVKETDGFIMNHTVLEKLKFDEKTLISPSTISHKFKNWDEFVERRQKNEIDEVVDYIAEAIRQGRFEELLKIVDKTIKEISEQS